MQQVHTIQKFWTAILLTVMLSVACFAIKIRGSALLQSSRTSIEHNSEKDSHPRTSIIPATDLLYPGANWIMHQ